MTPESSRHRYWYVGSGGSMCCPPNDPNDGCLETFCLKLSACLCCWHGTGRSHKAIRSSISSQTTRGALRPGVLALSSSSSRHAASITAVHRCRAAPLASGAKPGVSLRWAHRRTCAVPIRATSRSWRGRVPRSPRRPQGARLQSESELRSSAQPTSWLDFRLLTPHILGARC